MTNSWLPVGFERLERVRAANRVQSGSPVALLLEWAGDIGAIQTIPAITVLTHRWVPVGRAKRAVETLVAKRKVFVLVPKVEALDVVVTDLARAGVKATAIAGAEQTDVRALRDRLGLTQEQFAIRFGLDVDAVRNWEHGRRRPDTAAASYLRAICGNPDAVEAALWSPPSTHSRAIPADRQDGHV